MNCHLIVVNSWSLHGNSCEITNNDNLGDGIEFGLFEVVESGGMCCFVLRCSVTGCCMVMAGSTDRYSVTALQCREDTLTLEK